MYMQELYQQLVKIAQCFLKGTCDTGIQISEGKSFRNVGKIAFSWYMTTWYPHMIVLEIEFHWQT